VKLNITIHYSLFTIHYSLSPEAPEAPEAPLLPVPCSLLVGCWLFYLGCFINDGWQSSVNGYSCI